MKENGQLEGRVVIITGGTGGIGKATCFAMAKAGASIVVVDIDRSRIDELVAELDKNSMGKKPDDSHLGLDCDVRSEEDMENMARKTVARFGRIDMLVHCAGILRGKDCQPSFLHQISTREWEEVIDTNLKGTFLANRAVLPFMIKEKNGHIINFSSTSGLQGRALDSVYCASKFGIIGLSESLAEEVRQYGIKVSVVKPDAVDTPIWDQNGPIISAPKHSLPPERVADLVVYLAMLPEDTILNSLIIRSFKMRRRKKKK
jgi:3-oxoacyl-[acyl-carrier protein] reductase